MPASAAARPACRRRAAARPGASPAGATSLCETTPSPLRRLPGRAIRALLKALALAVPLVFAPLALAADARALYRDGTRALAEHRYADARALLGEAVRLDPDFAGAWLDLALATYAAGDLAQAEELLDVLQARFVVPPALQGVIARLREQIALGLAPPDAATLWRWRRQLTAAVGRDSNANAGLAQGELALTLPGGAVLLPVARDQRARADTFAQVGVAAQAARPLAAGFLDLRARAQGRRNVDVTDFDTAEWQLGAVWTAARPLDNGALRGVLPGVWQLRSDFEQLHLGGDTLTQTIAAGVGHLWRHDGCWPRLDVDLEQRRYPVAHSLDATHLWFGGALTCPGVGGPGSRELSVQARGGVAVARHGSGAQARPGGDTRLLDVTVAHGWAWRGPTGSQTLQALVRWEHLRDREGYSPLLADGARRRIDRYSGAVSWSMPLAPGAGWRLTVTAQQLTQRANLDPFDLDGRIAQVGVERLW